MKTFKTNDKLRSSEVNSNYELLTSGAEMHYNAAWTSYDIGWFSDAGFPSLGSGTLSGRYIRIGRLVIVRVFFKAAADTSFDSGAWSFTLPGGLNPSIDDYPEADKTSRTGSSVGTAYIEDLASLGYFGSVDLLPAANLFRILVHRADSTYSVENWLTSTAPFTWATGDFFSAIFMYECEESIT